MEPSGLKGGLKAGPKTTEFWITVLMIVAIGLRVWQGESSPSDVVAAAIAAAGYSFSRGHAKAGRSS